MIMNVVLARAGRDFGQIQIANYIGLPCSNSFAIEYQKLTKTIIALAALGEMHSMCFLSFHIGRTRLAGPTSTVRDRVRTTRR